jgi:hypothetical protein
VCRLLLVLMDIARPLQGILDVFADVLVADVPVEVSARNQVRGLVAGTAQQKVPVRLSHGLSQVFESPETGCVERRHVAQAQDHHRG